MQTQKTIKKAIFFLITSIVFQSTIFASNNIVTKNYVLNQFSTLKISNSFQVEFKHSNENKVSVEIDENTLKNLSVTNTNNELSLKLKDCNFCKTKTLKAIVYGNSLIAIFVSGASTFTSDYTFIGKEISIKNSGASRINIIVKTEKLDIDVSGASKINVNGSATKLLLDASGASNYNGKNCKNNFADISASGASKVIVDCSDTLEVKPSGASSIKYISTPKTINKVTSGASNVVEY